MNILIVDDEPVQIESLTRGLRTKGYTVFGALSAEAALDRINNHPPIDMVLTDFDLKGMDGMELLRTIREKNAALPVIMTTTYGEKNLLIEALRNRCNSFLEKPFTLDQLVKEIERTRIDLVKRSISDGLSEQMQYLAHYLRNATAPALERKPLFEAYYGEVKNIVENLDKIMKSAPEAASDIEKVQLLINGVTEVVYAITIQIDEATEYNVNVYGNVVQASRELQKFIENLPFSSSITQEISTHLNEGYIKHARQADQLAQGLFKLSNQFKELAEKFTGWEKPKQELIKEE